MHQPAALPLIIKLQLPTLPTLYGAMLAGVQCSCIALLAAIGQAQTRPDGTVEPPIATSGDDLAIIGDFLGGRTHSTAADVIDQLSS